MCVGVLRSEQCASYRYVDDDRFVSFRRETAKYDRQERSLDIPSRKKNEQYNSFHIDLEQKQITIFVRPRSSKSDLIE